MTCFFLVQKFFLQGRLIFGPDVRSLALTVFLIVAPISVFCVFVAHKLMSDSYDNWGGYIMAIAIVLTSCVCPLSLFHPPQVNMPAKIATISEIFYLKKYVSLGLFLI